MFAFTTSLSPDFFFFLKINIRNNLAKRCRLQRDRRSCSTSTVCLLRGFHWSHSTSKCSYTEQCQTCGTDFILLEKWIFFVNSSQGQVFFFLKQNPAEFVIYAVTHFSCILSFPFKKKSMLLLFGGISLIFLFTLETPFSQYKDEKWHIIIDPIKE